MRFGGAGGQNRGMDSCFDLAFGIENRERIAHDAFNGFFCTFSKPCEPDTRILEFQFLMVCDGIFCHIWQPVKNSLRGQLFVDG